MEMAIKIIRVAALLVTSVLAAAAICQPAMASYYELRAGCPSDLNNEFVSIDPPAVPPSTWRKVFVVWFSRKPETEVWTCDVLTDTTTKKQVRVLTLKCDGGTSNQTPNDKEGPVVATLIITKLALRNSVSVKFVHAEMRTSEVHESRMVDNCTRPFIKPLKEYAE